jgi:hypothetical protein
MHVRETSGTEVGVGKHARVLGMNYMRLILLRMHGCQYGKWKET